MSFPKVFRLGQTLAGPAIADPAAEIRHQLAAIKLQERIQPDQRVAITAGSRGISNIDRILRAIVDWVKERGAQPFIVPAMGSHGGANVAGQLEVLRTYDITDQTMGCPILASMDTTVVCQAPQGFEVNFDRHAFEADHVIVCNRIKPHTDFDGAIQSGLMKMMLIGLGKHRGASIYHRAFRDYSFDEIVRSVSATVIRNCRIAAGVAIVENGHEHTALIEAMRPEDIVTREPELLKQAYEWMARLPFDQIDVLVVDEIGKNISGTGMDTNVVGRKRYEHTAAPGERPQIKKIIVRGLTEATHGNATGIGVADFTTEHVVNQIDFPATRVNCVTSGRTAVGMLPLYFPTDRETITAALNTIGLTPPEQAKLVHIPNTLHLAEMWCSEAYLPEAAQQPNLKILSDPMSLEFSATGELIGPRAEK
ncbi:MAG: DUF362 domain-containing protein [Planctomycetales bacterium]|nr:DUF362 domain-containing protein [Planctomycetales bacterium]